MSTAHAWRPSRLTTSVMMGALVVGLAACKPPSTGNGQPTTASAPEPVTTPVSVEETRAIAKDAFIWGFPMVESYKTLHAQALEPNGPNFRAPFNQLRNVADVFTPKDTAIVTPNSDTPYSFLWMDLRAEPLVLTIPKIDGNRYFSVQLIDLYTHNFDYIGTRTGGRNGGVYLVAGPDWKGEAPKGVDKVLRSETQLAYALYRTQLSGPDDLDNVKRLQAGYKVQPLSAFAGTDAPVAAPAIDFPAYDAATASGLGFFGYLNFLMQFEPTHPSEVALRERFAKIGIVPGQPFDEAPLSPEIRQALLDGIAEANQEMATFKKTKVDTQAISSADLFGTREFLKNNYLYRFAGAKMGIYGNSGDEANYEGYFVDAKHQPLDAAKHDYVLHFGKDQLPPTQAFWSMTMYDGKSQLLVDNPINRYLINSPMLPELKRDAEGGITLYVQYASPGKDKESNWLPAPNGPFFAVLRNYAPDTAVVEHTWKRPELQQVK